MKKFTFYHLIFTFICSVFLLSGCQQMYIPNMQNVPMSKEKGDLKLMLNPRNIQASYTVTDHIGIIGNGFYRQNSWSLSSGSVKEEFTNTTGLFELGAGYYSVFGETGVLEVYAGGGIGSVTHNLDYLENDTLVENNTLSATMSKFFVQPSIGHAGEHFEFAFTPKVTGVQFTGSQISNYSEDELTNYELNSVENSDLFMFFEPGITLRGGIPEVKGHVQTAYSTKFTGGALNYKRLILNFGVHVNITKTIEALR